MIRRLLLFLVCFGLLCGCASADTSGVWYEETNTLYLIGGEMNLSTLNDNLYLYYTNGTFVNVPEATGYIMSVSNGVYTLKNTKDIKTKNGQDLPAGSEGRYTHGQVDGILSFDEYDNLYVETEGAYFANYTLKLNNNTVLSGNNYTSNTCVFPVTHDLNNITLDGVSQLVFDGEGDSYTISNITVSKLNSGTDAALLFYQFNDSTFDNIIFTKYDNGNGIILDTCFNSTLSHFYIPSGYVPWEEGGESAYWLKASRYCTVDQTAVNGTSRSGMYANSDRFQPITNHTIKNSQISRARHAGFDNQGIGNILENVTAVDSTGGAGIHLTSEVFEMYTPWQNLSWGPTYYPRYGIRIINSTAIHDDYGDWINDNTDMLCNGGNGFDSVYDLVEINQKHIGCSWNHNKLDGFIMINSTRTPYKPEGGLSDQADRCQLGIGALENNADGVNNTHIIDTYVGDLYIWNCQNTSLINSNFTLQNELGNPGVDFDNCYYYQLNMSAELYGKIEATVNNSSAKVRNGLGQPRTVFEITGGKNTRPPSTNNLQNYLDRAEIMALPEYHYHSLYNTILTTPVSNNLKLYVEPESTTGIYERSDSKPDGCIVYSGGVYRYDYGSKYANINVTVTGADLDADPWEDSARMQTITEFTTIPKTYICNMVIA